MRLRPAAAGHYQRRLDLGCGGRLRGPRLAYSNTSALRPNPRAFTTTLYPDSLSRCEDVWRARRDFCGRLFDEQNLFFFSDPPRVILAPHSLQGLQGCREKQKVLLIKQALQALRARILAPPPQVRCAGDDDVSFLHRGGLWPARCQGMRSTRLGGGVEGEQSF